MCGNDRDVVSIRNTFLVRNSIREVARNIFISRLHRCTASVGLAKARPNYSHVGLRPFLMNDS